VMVEIHPKPFEAFSDGNQSLNYAQYAKFLEDLGIIQDAILKLRKQKFDAVANHVPDYSA